MAGLTAGTLRCASGRLLCFMACVAGLTLVTACHSIMQSPAVHRTQFTFLQHGLL
jgi:hypothetical protein